MSKLYCQNGLLEKALPKFCVTCEHFELCGWCNMHNSAFDHEDYCTYWEQNNKVTIEDVVNFVTTEIEHCELRIDALEQLRNEVDQRHDANILLNNLKEEDN